MDDSRFDQLAKNLAGELPRRSFRKQLGKVAVAAIGIGGPIGTVLWSRAGDAAACRNGGVSCLDDGHCCSGECGEPDGRRCACAEPQFACGARCCNAGDICAEGACRTPTPLATDTPTTTPTSTATDTPTNTPTNTPTSTATNTPTDTPTNTPVPGCGSGGPCLVFVTEAAITGAIGGLSGGNDLCQGEAEDAGLSGTFAVWLSTSTSSPATSFYHSPNPYTLVNGTVVASNWTDLTDGSLQSPINRTAAGDVIPPGGVWTSTGTDGLLYPGPGTCNDWVSDSGGDGGRVGSVSGADFTWTSYVSQQCSQTFRFFCFQQAATGG
jgi:hypothetical protein